MIVRVRCQPNQRAGTDCHTEPEYLLTGSRPGHAAPDSRSGAAVLLLPLIEVAPECAVNALDAGATCECVAVTLDTEANWHIRECSGPGVSISITYTGGPGGLPGPGGVRAGDVVSGGRREIPTGAPGQYHAPELRRSRLRRAHRGRHRLAAVSPEALADSVTVSVSDICHGRVSLSLRDTQTETTK